MRPFILVGLLVALTATAHADLPTAIPMDGPFPTFACAQLAPPGGTCQRVAHATIAGHRVEVQLVIDRSYAVATVDVARFHVVVKTPAGWFVSHGGVEIELFWKEHGPGHQMKPGRPRLSALALASGRAALALDVPVKVLADGGRLPGFASGLMACGETAGGRWSCLPGLTSYLPSPARARFDRDGRLRHARAAGHSTGSVNAARSDEQDGDQLTF